MAPTNGGDTMAAFRQKVAYMKNWKPSSSPSNRDRLELYALHKQAVSGDAPATLATQTAAERAKYQSWKSKAGLLQTEAIRLYMQEADRQIRVYGGGLTTFDSSDQANGGNGIPPVNDEVPPPQQPRGLAAIPLLCAAASESRPAYLRRLANTRLEQAWWRRQEPLTAAPGTLWSFPEFVLLAVASFLEYMSLTADGTVPLPSGVVQMDCSVENVANHCVGLASDGASLGCRMERSSPMERAICTNFDGQSPTLDSTIDGIGLVAIFYLGHGGQHTRTGLVESRSLLRSARRNMVVLVPGIANGCLLALGCRHFGRELLRSYRIGGCIEPWIANCGRDNDF
eukprot:scaffold34635_cov208-Amphora_coffeaeformis.AAC.2